MSNQVFDLERFVNRDEEMEFIREKCLASLKANRPINPQFIEFNGVWGIGKTTVLRRIEHDCATQNLPPIWIEASDNPDLLFHRIADQVRHRHAVSFTSIGDALDESVAATQALLRKYDAAVVLIDSLDAAEEDHLKRIEEMLHRFIENRKLLFIMASRKMIDFKNIAPIKRKLKFLSLKSFSRVYCASYINKLTQEFKAEEIDHIFQLTSGYPRAVDVAVETIRQEKLNLAEEQDRKRLVQTINEQVIEQGILANIRHEPEQLLWYQEMLSLFAVPRRFNLTIMQKMTEKFAERYKLGSSLAYMSLHQRINLNTGLLDWHEARTGYSMASPVRNLFLVKLKTENQERYTQIHEFLMEQNWRLAMEVSITDRVHYIQEYLYHSAFCVDSVKLQENIDKAMKQILDENRPDSLLQFEEEYKKDTELQEALGVHRDSVLAKICRHYADSYWELVATALDKQERVSHLLSYTRYTIKDPTVIVVDRLPLVRQCLQQIKAQESADVYRSLLVALTQDTEVGDLLDDDPQTWNLE
jgi:hypothetical protein